MCRFLPALVLPLLTINLVLAFPPTRTLELLENAVDGLADHHVSTELTLGPATTSSTQSSSFLEQATPWNPWISKDRAESHDVTYRLDTDQLHTASASDARLPTWQATTPSTTIEKRPLMQPIHPLSNIVAEPASTSLAVSTDDATDRDHMTVDLHQNLAPSEALDPVITAFRVPSHPGWLRLPSDIVYIPSPWIKDMLKSIPGQVPSRIKRYRQLDIPDDKLRKIIDGQVNLFQPRGFAFLLKASAGQFGMSTPGEYLLRFHHQLIWGDKYVYKVMSVWSTTRNGKQLALLGFYRTHPDRFEDLVRLTHSRPYSPLQIDPYTYLRPVTRINTRRIDRATMQH